MQTYGLDLTDSGKIYKFSFATTLTNS